MQPLKNIAFFWIGEDITIPSMLVHSIRLAFGQNFNIFQLSDRDTPMVKGVTVHKKLKLSQHIMVARLEAYSSAPITEPTLFVDADMLVLRPFVLPTLAEHEVGVTIRGERDNLSFSEETQVEFPEFAGKDTLQVMPYIFSFVYVRSTLLFLRQLNALRKMPKRFQRWYGDQVTLKRELDATGRFTIKPFDINQYNHTVKSRWDFEEALNALDSVYIVHFKGAQSKQVMHEALSMITKPG